MPIFNLFSLYHTFSFYAISYKLKNAEDNLCILDRRKSRSTASKLVIMFECRARACSCRIEIQMYKTPRKTSNFPWGYLLFANLNSTVPSYANEFKLTKYNFLFRNLPACRCVYRHAEMQRTTSAFF